MDTPVRPTFMFAVVTALAALAAGIPAPARAQGGAVAQPRRDSVLFRIVAPSRAQLDTIRTLMRQLEQLPPESPASAQLRDQIRVLLPDAHEQMSVMLRGVQALPAKLPRGWIGLNVEGPHSEMFNGDGFVIEYFDHPLITSVDPDSPAQRAGIEPGDVLLGYNGTDVLGHRFDLTEMLVPDKRLGVTVRRDGELKEFGVVVAKAPQQIFSRRLGSIPGGDVQVRVGKDMDGPNGVGIALPRVAGQKIFMGRAIMLTPNGAFGAVMSTVTPDLAKALRLETGVLVNDVTDDTPASRAGLRAGDVIVSAGGQASPSLKALQEIVLRRGESSVPLQVVRERKTRTITVSW